MPLGTANFVLQHCLVVPPHAPKVEMRAADLEDLGDEVDVAKQRQDDVDGDLLFRDSRILAHVRLKTFRL